MRADQRSSMRNHPFITAAILMASVCAELPRKPVNPHQHRQHSRTPITAMTPFNRFCSLRTFRVRLARTFAAVLERNWGVSLTCSAPHFGTDTVIPCQFGILLSITH